MVSKKLKNLIKLSSKVCIYVPSTIDANKVIDSSEYKKKTLEFLTKNFGGATATEASGQWESSTEGMIVERITLCYSYTTTEGLEENIDAVLHYCYRLKKEMGQENISLEINNELYFI